MSMTALAWVLLAAAHLRGEPGGYDVATVAFEGGAAGGCKSSHLAPSPGASAWTPPDTQDLSVKMYVAVLTHPSHRERRDAVRSTWKREADGHPAVKVEFILCNDVFLDARADKAIEEENVYWRDLAMVPCSEGYGGGNLTRKVVAAMERFAGLPWGSGKSVFMKVDDDTLLRANAVLEVARRTAMATADFYMGYMHPAGVRPIRNPADRWYEPCSVFKEKAYPTTASGAAYALSAGLVQRFIHQDNAAVRTRLLWNEDRAVASWVQYEVEQHVPVTFVNLPGLDSFQGAKAAAGGEMRSEMLRLNDWRNLGYLVIHKLWPKQMVCVWQHMTRGDTISDNCFTHH